MSKITITTVKKALAAAFPEVQFGYGTGGRGHMRGHSVSWTGGPSADEVTAKVPGGVAQWGWGKYSSVLMHVSRRMTAEESAVYMAELDARYEADRLQREAEAPARKAAAIAQRKDTVARKKAAKTQLESSFPGVAFTLEKTKYGNGFHVEWTDGPGSEEVGAILGEGFHFHRKDSPEAQEPLRAAYEARRAAAPRIHNGKAMPTAATRLARRLAASVKRRLIVARAMARRALRAAQLWLPLDLPIVRAV